MSTVFSNVSLFYQVAFHWGMSERHLSVGNCTAALYLIVHTSLFLKGTESLCVAVFSNQVSSAYLHSSEHLFFLSKLLPLNIL